VTKYTLLVLTIITNSTISMLQDHYHWISSYQSLKCSSSLVLTWSPNDVDLGLKIHDYGFEIHFFFLSNSDSILPIWDWLWMTWFSLCSWFISTLLLGSLSKRIFSMTIMDFCIYSLFSYILFSIPSLFSLILFSIYILSLRNPPFSTYYHPFH